MMPPLENRQAGAAATAAAQVCEVFAEDVNVVSYQSIIAADCLIDIPCGLEEPVERSYDHKIVPCCFARAQVNPAQDREEHASCLLRSSSRR